ncbi:hypothetical protein M3Y97_00084700 [Aphelenchoides bicaudatus]|nr:hypothetical protein M3Y97_00084700 [Aphelenchoides bicaudatus]
MIQPRVFLVMNDDQPLSPWYFEPLTLEDILAAGILIVFGVFFICLYSIVAYVMLKCDKEIVGFRFLFSASIADILLLFNYTIWPGLTILFKSEIIPRWSRHWVQFYLDWVWFSMCLHYIAIAWSRFAAIKYSLRFRIQSRTFSYSLCACCYVGALIQVLCTHFTPWYTVFYFDPEFYGMLSENFPKYLNEGQSLFFACFHFLMILIPAAFYGVALFLLLRHRKNGILAKKQTPKRVKSSSKQARAEARLIIPCILNSIVFLIGQVAITLGTGEGKWATWTVLVLFAINSAVNPILLLMFSAIIREKVLQFFRTVPQKPKHHKSSNDQHNVTHSTILVVNKQAANLNTYFEEEEIKIFITEDLSTEFSTYL